MKKKSVRATKIIKEKTTIYKPARVVKTARVVKEKKKPLSDREIQLALIENFVNLQKVLTNLSFKFDGLSQNITSLLQLYETAARNFVEKHEKPSVSPMLAGDDKELLKKLDTLLDQNKTIARGLTLIEDKIKHKVYSEGEGRIDFGVMGRPKPRPLPKI
jgi:hypothetical protein